MNLQSAWESINDTNFPTQRLLIQKGINSQHRAMIFHYDDRMKWQHILLKGFVSENLNTFSEIIEKISTAQLGIPKLEAAWSLPCPRQRTPSSRSPFPWVRCPPGLLGQKPGGHPAFLRQLPISPKLQVPKYP